MSPDEAAALLQIPERGPDLVKRCLTDDLINKAIQMVGSGFTPSDVAQALGLSWDKDLYEETVEQSLEGKIRVWECKTIRCGQKGKVATATDPPTCPQCGEEMNFLTAVDDVDEISHMSRVSVKRPKIKDPLKRTDRTNAPDYALGDDED